MSLSALELNTALRQVLPAIDRKVMHEVMANVMIVSSDGYITLTGTNNEIELKSSVDVDGDITATLPAQKLAKILSTLPDDARVKLNPKEDHVLLTTGRSKFKLATLPADEFPVIDPLTDPVTVTIPQQELKQAIAKTSFAMAKQDVRYYMNGLKIEIKSGRLRCVATDGHRLATTSFPVDCQDDHDIIIPHKTVTHLQKMLDEGDLELSLTSTHLQTEDDNRTVLTSKLIDSKYPDWQTVIPSHNDHATVDVAAFKSAIQRASILANEMFQGIKLTFSKNTIIIDANNPRHENATEELDCEYDGPDIEIGAKSVYMLDAMNACGDSAEIRLGGEGAILIKPDAETDLVVMPMRL